MLADARGRTGTVDPRCEVIKKSLFPSTLLRTLIKFMHYSFFPHETTLLETLARKGGELPPGPVCLNGLGGNRHMYAHTRVHYTYSHAQTYTARRTPMSLEIRRACTCMHAGLYCRAHATARARAAHEETGALL